MSGGEFVEALCRYCWAVLPDGKARDKACPCGGHCSKSHHNRDKAWNAKLGNTKPMHVGKQTA